MNVLTMQLNSITIMNLIAASLQIRKHKSKATETVKRKACRKRWLLLYGNLILRFIAGQDIGVSGTFGWGMLCNAKPAS